MSLSYDYYKTFYYVAKYRSLSKAAVALLCGQPNVTKAIGNLEAQLGCTLFFRTGRGVTLTPEGERLYAHVAIAYEHLTQAEAELLSARELETGTATIGTTETALYGLLIPVLEQFHRAHSKVKLRIFSYSTGQAIQALKNGAVDFCLVTTPLEEARQFRVTRLRDFREILCAGGQYRYLGEQPQDLSVLEDCPVISLGRSTKTYEFYSQFLLPHDREWKTDIEVSTADQMLPLVRRGLGIGFIGEFFLGDALFSGEVREIPLKEPPPCRSICLVEDTSRHLSIASAKIAEILKSAAQ